MLWIYWGKLNFSDWWSCILCHWLFETCLSLCPTFHHARFFVVILIIIIIRVIRVAFFTFFTASSFVCSSSLASPFLARSSSLSFFASSRAFFLIFYISAETSRFVSALSSFSLDFYFRLLACSAAFFSAMSFSASAFFLSYSAFFFSASFCLAAFAWASALIISWMRKRCGSMTFSL